MATETIFQVVQKQKLATSVLASLNSIFAVEEIRQDLSLGVEEITVPLSAVTLPALILVSASADIGISLYPASEEGEEVTPLTFKGRIFLYAPSTYTVPAVPASGETPEVPEIPPQAYSHLQIESLSADTSVQVRVVGI